MIAISGRREVADAIERARSVLVTSYVLRPGWMLDALEDASRHGASVRVRLEGRPYGDTSGELIADNRGAVKALRRLGADAKLVDRNRKNGPPLHMKAAICDGVAYLDDRNWPDDAADTIVRDDFRRDADAIQAAALHKAPPPTSWFWTNKRQALAGERRLLEYAADARTVDVQSESFGAGSGTYGALKQLAESGVRCRLVVCARDVNERSRNALRTLREAGVDVRAVNSDEKMAIVDGARAWVGSANSTSPHFDGDQIDWGLRTDASAVLAHMRERFESNWKGAAPVE